MNQTATNADNALGTENIRKLIFRLALPTVTAQIVNMLYNLVDRVYIGHIADIGEKALTGLGVCQPIILFIAAFSALICYGGAPRTAIAMGEKNNAKAEKILASCFTAQIVISVLLTVVFSVWHRDILLAFGASDATIEYACEYIRIYILGTLFVELSLGMNAFITAQGFASVAMKTVLVGAISNIVLDPIFIFAFPRLIGGMGACVFVRQKAGTSSAERKYAARFFAFTAVYGTRAFAVYHAGDRKRVIRLLQHVAQRIRRRYCGRFDDDSFEHQYVPHAAVTGFCSRRTAGHQL